VLRITGLVALVTLMLARAVPAVAGLVPFVLFTIWTNGPHSPVLFATYEPVLMLYGRLYPPILIGVLGTLGSVSVEYLNYHLYVKAADSRALRAVTQSRLVTVLGRWYARAPFLTIVTCALTPIPFWLARVLSAVTRYSLRRYLLATAVGRFPRLWFFAALGTLAIPTVWLAMAAAGSIVLAGLSVAFRAARRSAFDLERQHRGHDHPRLGAGHFPSALGEHHRAARQGFRHGAQ
jgi:uncharacterized membrane protein YdjX (TVP38/TMEM64 family)